VENGGLTWEQKKCVGGWKVCRKWALRGKRTRAALQRGGKLGEVLPGKLRLEICEDRKVKKKRERPSPKSRTP